MQSIRSRDNPLVKRLRALARSARECRKQGMTILDGDHLLAAALDAGVPLQHVLLSESGTQRDGFVTLAQRSGCPMSVLPDSLFASVSPVDTPSGVLALMAVPPSVPARPAGTVLVLDGVQDAGNLGNILRTAAAAGVTQAWLTEGCAQAWSPRVLRAGMGAHFALSIAERVDAVASLAGFPGDIIATELGEGAASLYECPLGGSVAWLFGSEGQGLARSLSAMATRRVQIPMPGRIESLNVAAAVAVCLFEQLRRCC